MAGKRDKLLQPCCERQDDDATLRRRYTSRGWPRSALHLR